jgi:hypothetical protein
MDTCRPDRFATPERRPSPPTEQGNRHARRGNRRIAGSWDRAAIRVKTRRSIAGEVRKPAATVGVPRASAVTRAARAAPKSPRLRSGEVGR